MVVDVYIHTWILLIDKLLYKRNMSRYTYCRNFLIVLK